MSTFPVPLHWPVHAAWDGGGSSPFPVADALLCMSAGSGKQGVVLASGSRRRCAHPHHHCRQLACPVPVLSAEYLMEKGGGCPSALLYLASSFRKFDKLYVQFHFFVFLMVSFLIHGLFRK